MNRRSSLLVAFLISGCGHPSWEEGSEIETAEDPVFGGRRDSRHAGVGQVGRLDEDGVVWFCSGTLIDPFTVLTAAHCLYAADGWRWPDDSLVFGVGEDALAVRSTETADYRPGARGAWSDIATLQLDSAASIRPIPIATEPPVEGDPATVVGYGVTRATGPHAGVGAGTRRAARIILDDLGAQEIRYRSDTSGACYGDSGGPLLQRIDRQELVIGVTSRGTREDCTGIDIATRVDAYADWIEASSPPETTRR